MIEDYQIIVDSVINGQKKQAVRQFNGLNDKGDFIAAIECSLPDDLLITVLLVLLKGVSYEC